MKKYFSNDPNGDGLVFHKAATVARAAAVEALVDERDRATGGEWSDEVTDICWGEVIEHVVETERRPVERDDDGDPLNADVDEYVDYGLEFTGPAPRTVSLPEVLEVLNRAVEADPEAIAALIGTRVPCNPALAGDPTIQVDHRGDDPQRGFSVGALGLLNGLFGTRPNGWGYLVAEVDNDEQRVIRFYEVDNGGREVKS